MKYQRGSTVVGFIAGVVVGLAIALAVAMYITKVPVPFVRESPSRTADQDADESRKNKDWDPNAPLYGKNPARPASASASDATAGNAKPPAVAASTPAKPASSTIVAPASAPTKTAASADPIGDMARQKAGATADPFIYFVQIGAFNNPQDAEAQRAKLSLSGVDVQVSERDQSGRTVYRVRSGPLNTKDEADKVKERIEAAGFEAALVRVQR